MAADYQIDNLDVQILNILMENAFTPYTDIGKKLYVSPGTVHVRMNKMEKMGIIENPQLRVNLHKLGMDVTAFIGVFLVKSDSYEKVVNALKKVEEVVTCHYTTGNYSLLIKIICRDTRHLRDVLYEKIQKIDGVARTETLIVLEESFSRPIRLREDKGEE